MRRAPRRTVEPTLWPVTVDECKEELGIIDTTDTSQDVRLTRLIKEATAIVERDSRRQILTQTWQLSLDAFPCEEIELWRVPVASVAFVKYTTDEELTTWATTNYATDLTSEPARIQPVSGTYWPGTDDCVNAVLVQWVAGYASAALVPHEIKAAVIAVVVHKYLNCDLGENYWHMIKGLRRADDALH